MLSSARLVPGCHVQRMLYPLFRPLLFALDPETAHELSLASLDAAASLGVAQLVAPHVPRDPITVMGIAFPNRVGLAAGLDKNAAHIDALATLGFGFIECGTVTPRPQPGNPRPRLFRVSEKQALINRLGFNNDGIERFVANVTRARFGRSSGGVLGLNIGRNFDTPNERAAEDYLRCLRSLYPHASYVTVNVSSPNTEGLRDLQAEAALDRLLGALKAEQAKLADRHGAYTPLAVKIAPDLGSEEIRRIARTLVAHRIDGVVATNTTVDHSALAGCENGAEAGGVSGRPLKEKSTAAIRTLAAELGGAMPIIGVGGIMSGADAREKIDAGATLLQIYTGLIFKGPGIVSEIGAALAKMRQRPVP